MNKEYLCLSKSHDQIFRLFFPNGLFIYICRLYIIQIKIKTYNSKLTTFSLSPNNKKETKMNEHFLPHEWVEKYISILFYRITTFKFTIVVNSKPMSAKIFLRATEDDPRIICNRRINVGMHFSILVTSNKVEENNNTSEVLTLNS